jgi:hypothetical protein
MARELRSRPTRTRAAAQPSEPVVDMAHQAVPGAEVRVASLAQLPFSTRSTP